MILISASQIELWKMCKRRWAFRYLQGFESPEGDAAQAGKLVHALLDSDFPPIEVSPWKHYDISRMAHELYKHTPQDDVLWGREVEFERELFGVMFKGIIDRLSDQFVLDWKTISAQLKYARSLKRNVQRLLYSQAYPEIPFAKWVTGTWATSKAAVADDNTTAFDTKFVLLPRDHDRDTEAFKELVLVPAEEILQVDREREPLSFEMPSNYENPYDSPCKKFPPDGCPHFDACHKRSRLASAIRKLPVILPSLVQVAEAAEAVDAAEPQPEYLIENLYVDCMPFFPTDKPLTYAWPLIVAASAEKASELQIPHILLAEFSRGPAFLSVELVAHIEEIAPVEHLYLETKSAEGRGVMHTLMGKSRHVYKGTY